MRVREIFVRACEIICLILSYRVDVTSKFCRVTVNRAFRQLRIRELEENSSGRLTI